MTGRGPDHGAYLALGLALSCLPAQAAELKLVASVQVLERDRCALSTREARFAIESADPAKARARVKTTLRCTGSAPSTALRIRSDDRLNGSSRLHLPRSVSVPRGVGRTVKGLATAPAGALAGPGADPVLLIIEP